MFCIVCSVGLACCAVDSLSGASNVLSTAKAVPQKFSADCLYMLLFLLANGGKYHILQIVVSLRILVAHEDGGIVPFSWNDIVELPKCLFQVWFHGKVCTL